MAKLGQSVLYNGVSPRQVGIVTKLNVGSNVDLAVWEGESWAPKTDVPRNDDGAGHSWQPIAE
jgi:hypothetical protein